MKISNCCKAKMVGSDYNGHRCLKCKQLCTPIEEPTEGQKTFEHTTVGENRALLTPSEATIFPKEVREDWEEELEELKKEWKRRGYAIVPTEPSDLDIDSFEKHRMEAAGVPTITVRIDEIVMLIRYHILTARKEERAGSYSRSQMVRLIAEKACIVHKEAYEQGVKDGPRCHCCGWLKKEHCDCDKKSDDKCKRCDELPGCLQFENEEVNSARQEATALAREMSALLEVARCPEEFCDNNGTIANQISLDEWEPQQCQWCYEKTKALADLSTNLK